MITWVYFPTRSCLKEKNPPAFSLTHPVPHREKCLNQMYCLAHCKWLSFSLGEPFIAACKQSKWGTNVKDVSGVYFRRKTRTLSTEHGSGSTTYHFQQEAHIGKQSQQPHTLTRWPAVPKVVPRVLHGQILPSLQKNLCRLMEGSVPVRSSAHTELAARAGLQFPMPAGEHPDSYLFSNACTDGCKFSNLPKGTRKMVQIFFSEQKYFHF